MIKSGGAGKLKLYLKHVAKGAIDMADAPKSGGKPKPDPTIWQLVKKSKFWSFCRAGLAILGILYLLGLAGQLRPWESGCANTARQVRQLTPSLLSPSSSSNAGRPAQQSELPPTNVHVPMYYGQQIENPDNWKAVKLEPDEFQVIEFERVGKGRIRVRPGPDCSACVDTLDGQRPIWVRPDSGLTTNRQLGAKVMVWGTGTILFQVLPEHEHD